MMYSPHECVLEEGNQPAYSIALDFFHHNFIPIHQTLKTTPAMNAGISKHPMKIEDIVKMLPLPIAQ